MGERDYPTEDELRQIREWPYEDPTGWLEFVRSCWWAADWGFHDERVEDESEGPVHLYQLSTGGWSGNEEIIGAMQGNYLLWGRTWQSSRRGGHYRFFITPLVQASDSEREA